MIYKIFKYFALIFCGPIVTVIIYVANERDVPISDIIQLIYIAYGLGAITLLVSILAYLFIKKFKHSLIASVIAAEMFYLTVLICYILFFETENKAENIMWLPVMIIFMIPFTLPMAISISYGTGKLISLVKTIKQGEEVKK